MDVKLLTNTENDTVNDENDVNDTIMSEEPNVNNHESQELQVSASSPFIESSINNNGKEEEDVDEQDEEGVTSDHTIPEADDAMDEDVGFSDVELSDDENDKELTCRWDECLDNFKGYMGLNDHLVREHVPKGDVCNWEKCGEKKDDKYQLFAHLREHTMEKAFICPSGDCEDSFIASDDLSSHIWESHLQQQQLQKTNPQLSQYFSYVDELKYFPYSIGKSNDIESLKRFTKLTEREFNRILQSKKIDFLKIQNISVNDILTEPSKKKGRTANSEINAELRESYKNDNSQYKDMISEISNEIFKANFQDLEDFPLDEEIDRMDPDQLKELHDKLERKLLWGLEVHNLLDKQLNKSEEEKGQVWRRKEILLDSNIRLEVPENENLYTIE